MGTKWRWLYLNLVGFFLLITGSFLFWVTIPKIIIARVAEQQALVNGSEAWKRWVNTPLPVEFKIYMFNVTNPDRVVLGEKPILQEVGPYVYHEYKYKVDLKVNQRKDTVFYRQRARFEFRAEKSNGLSENDIVTIIHPALMGMVETMSKIPYLGNFSVTRLDKVIPTLFGGITSPFLTASVKDILFDGILIKCNQPGFPTDVMLICSGLRSMLPMTAITETKDGNFVLSVFGYKNNSDEGLMEVHSGISRPDLMGTIVSWKEKNHTEAWQEPCNRVLGVDVTLPPSHPSRNMKIFIFSSDMCSAVGLDYSEEVTYAGIKAFRYSPQDSFMESADKVPENKCYCPGRIKSLTKPSECLKSGVQDLSSCLDAPIVLSRPHFHLADPEYAKSVEGLKPDPIKHATYMDLEQFTGTPIRGYRRFQINMFLRKNSYVSLLRDVPSALVPILWLDEGCELTQKEVDLMNTLLFNILNIISTVKWFWMTTGIILVIVGPGMMVYKSLGEEKESTVKRKEEECLEKLG